MILKKYGFKQKKYFSLITIHVTFFSGIWSMFLKKYGFKQKKCFSLITIYFVSKYKFKFSPKYSGLLLMTLITEQYHTHFKKITKYYYFTPLLNTRVKD